MPTDTEAPYGRHPDGTPKRSAGGRPPGAKTGSRKTARKPAAARKDPTPPRKPAAATPPKDVDYREAFSEQAKWIGGLVAMGSPLDGLVFLSCADEIGDVGHEIAQINDYARKLGDRFLKLGPYGRLTNLGLKIGGQICANHGWLPDSITGLVGAVPRRQFAAQFEMQVRQAEAAQAAWAAQQAQESTAPYPADSDVPNGVPFTRHEYAGASA